MNYTILKYEETFTGRHTELTPPVVNINKDEFSRNVRKLTFWRVRTRRLRSACANAQADPCLRCAHEEIFLSSAIKNALNKDSDHIARMIEGKFSNVSAKFCRCVPFAGTALTELILACRATVCLTLVSYFRKQIIVSRENIRMSCICCIDHNPTGTKQTFK